MTVVVNLGYGGDNLGYSTPANAPTPLRLFPQVPLTTIGQELAAGAHQGAGAFVSDLQHENLSLSSPVPHASPSSLMSALTALPTTTFDPAQTITRVAYAFSSAASALYSSLVPTADILNAFVTAMPAYDVSLFLANLSNPLYAIGLPIAADVGFITVGTYVASAIILEDVATAVGDVLGLIL